MVFWLRLVKMILSSKEIFFHILTLSWTNNPQSIVTSFIKECSTDNFLTVIFSPSLWSLGHVTSRAIGVNSECRMQHDFIYFFGIFFVDFYHKICVFIIFISFFWWSIKILRQNINQSETDIGDEKLTVEFFPITIQVKTDY